eukprot:GEZU01019038.1.p1 GENE.GEZU01019038.1~~GEZU01019038.1.p1  ORF type:complete len:226 (-),score=73.75 GEZU01019038.1:728-1405(-)
MGKEIITSEQFVAARAGSGAGPMQIIPENEECKRRVTRRTLFYMPHCSLRMYENVLRANWGDNVTERKVIIFGNSFQSYALRLARTGTSSSEKQKQQQVRRKNNNKYKQQQQQQPASSSSIMARILPHTVEYPVKNSFEEFKFCFNDLGIHVFSKAPINNSAAAVTSQHCNSVDVDDFWNPALLPPDDDDDDDNDNNSNDESADAAERHHGVRPVPEMIRRQRSG